MADHSLMRLGKRAPRQDQRTLMLANYLTGELPPLLPSVDYSKGITDWGMMLNDQLGCCTIAAVGHAVQSWTVSSSGRELTVPDSTIRQYYMQWDGYNPADPSTDQGGVELDVLNNWRQSGFAGHILDAYAGVKLVPDMGFQISEVMRTIQLFGGAYVGVELPLTAQTQDVWDVVPGNKPEAQAGSWGGHAFWLLGYNAKTLVGVTWRKLKYMTWEWFHQYCSEAYALVSEDWLEESGISVSGFDRQALFADLKYVTA